MEFRRPREVSRDSVHPDLDLDDRKGMLAALGFGSESVERLKRQRELNDHAAELGFESASAAAELADALRASGLAPDAAARLLRAQVTAGSFPDGERVADPERRRRAVRERRENAPPRDKVRRERSVQPGTDRATAEARAYLRGKYTSEGTLWCQLCGQGMPFRLPSGDPYFEAVQFVRGLDRLYFENRLALCPVCAARYQHTLKCTEDDLRRRVLATRNDGGQGTVEVVVELHDGPAKLRFVSHHAFDLCTILEAPLDPAVLSPAEDADEE